MNKIAIIPARSGSKGLKNKNILDICGKPLIAYAIEEAIKSKEFSRVIVSTDSERYGKIAEKYGAEVVYRGENLSNDSATTYMVIKDVLDKCAEEYLYFVLLQPTSPMRNMIHIKQAIEKFENNYSKYDFLVSVKEAEYSKVLVQEIDKNNSLKNFDTDFSKYRRQNYKEYTPNGAIYIGKRDKYLEKKHFFGSKSLAYIMNEVDSIDIDNKLDYEFACFCMEKRLKGEI